MSINEMIEVKFNFPFKLFARGQVIELEKAYALDLIDHGYCSRIRKEKKVNTVQNIVKKVVSKKRKKFVPKNKKMKEENILTT